MADSTAPGDHDGFSARRCAQCGAGFGCGVNAARCWCHDMTLTTATLELMRQRFDACLCADCLRAWSSEATIAAP